MSKALLKQAADKGLLHQEQVAPLFHFLQQQNSAIPKFDFTHVLYYFGGLLAIGALTLFMTLGWEEFGGWGILGLSLTYAITGFTLTHYFGNRERHIPAGICAAFVVALTPLAIYGFQQGMGWWPDEMVYREYHRYIKFLWIYMELGTLLIGAVVTWKYRYPFILMPVAVTLWYMSMDMTELFYGFDFTWKERGLVSIWFGFGMILLAFLVDIRSRKTLDYAFWLYIFGVIAFWGGLTSQDSNSELNKFLYFCVNLMLIGAGAILVRKVFVVFGAFGCCGYFGHLAYDVFENSWLFPIALALIGLSVIWLGVLWQKNEAVITERIRSILPVSFRELLESRNV
ncbi:DUF2157 domain-containing protein [Sansalvadorimonas sp. 2012CJ34-2]|uniref:DUF2157 domain-containing protein n=1 Tax=Parendozoicomonas callyspongiae TaxID=2942213 RepID=A0ABT0PAU1_9GAMM|nr:DUF2157 domain-containing protein [Sansalvadorimonas sp. 2012CJ34-2]